MPRPQGFTQESPLTAQVDGVTWFEHLEPRVVRWTAIRKSANVELVVPRSYDAQGGFLVELGTALRAAVP